METFTASSPVSGFVHFSTLQTRPSTGLTTARGSIGNYFASGSALFAATLCPLIVPLILMIVLKFVGGFLVRCVLNTVYRKDFEND